MPLMVTLPVLEARFWKASLFEPVELLSVSYTHLTLPTKRIV